MERVPLHRDRPLEDAVTFWEEVHAHMAAVGVVAERRHEPGVDDLAQQQRDARLRTAKLACQGSRAGAAGAGGRHHQEKVVALLGETEARQRVRHDGLRLSEGPAQLGDELDVREGVASLLDVLGGHALNVHGGTRVVPAL